MGLALAGAALSDVHCAGEHWVKRPVAGPEIITSPARCSCGRNTNMTNQVGAPRQRSCYNTGHADQYCNTMSVWFSIVS